MKVVPYDNFKFGGERVNSAENIITVETVRDPSLSKRVAHWHQSRSLVYLHADLSIDLTP